MTRRGRLRSAWPAWKLRLYLPQGWRRWEVLRLVQLTGAGDHGEWQLQLLDGTPAGAGLFADRKPALKWARAHAGRVDVVVSEEVRRAS